MCDKAVDTYPSPIKYVLNLFKTQEICDKAVDKSHFLSDFVLDQFKFQEKTVEKQFLIILLS